MCDIRQHSYKRPRLGQGLVEGKSNREAIQRYLPIPEHPSADRPDETDDDRRVQQAAKDREQVREGPGSTREALHRNRLDRAHALPEFTSRWHG